MGAGGPTYCSDLFELIFERYASVLRNGAVDGQALLLSVAAGILEFRRRSTCHNSTQRISKRNFFFSSNNTSLCRVSMVLIRFPGRFARDSAGTFVSSC